MRIENHRLVSDDIHVSFDLDEQGGPLVPELVVIHYSVALTAKSTAAVLEAREYVSCHVSFGAGEVIQQVPFNRIAWHAGKSSYLGRSNANAFSIGIEIASPGPLIKRGDQYFPTWSGAKPWTGGVVEAWHKHDTARRGWKYWAEYPPEDVDLVIHLCELLRQTYRTIKWVCGHDDVSPGRKSDPGPAFPMRAVQDAVFPASISTDVVTPIVADAMRATAGIDSQPPRDDSDDSDTEIPPPPDTERNS